MLYFACLMILFDPLEWTLAKKSEQGQNGNEFWSGLKSGYISHIQTLERDVITS